MKMLRPMATPAAPPTRASLVKPSTWSAEAAGDPPATITGMGQLAATSAMLAREPGYVVLTTSAPRSAARAAAWATSSGWCASAIRGPRG